MTLSEGHGPSLFWPVLALLSCIALYLMLPALGTHLVLSVLGFTPGRRC